jgi:Subtilase family
LGCKGARLWRDAVVLLLLAGMQLLALGALDVPDAIGATVSPLPESDYVARPVCGAPRPGRAGCLALELQPVKPAAWWSHKHPLGMRRNAPAAAKAREGVYGLRPEDLQHAYFHGEAPLAPSSSPQTIALVDAYNDYEAATDLRVYSGEFGLPELPGCVSGQSSACFEQVNQTGESSPSALPFPRSETDLQEEVSTCESGKTTVDELACEQAESAEGWAVEMSLDIEMAHAVCENCKVLLVEAKTPSTRNLDEAVETAVRLGATEVSNSWGGEEPEREPRRAQSVAAFRHPGTVITASAGDNGYRNWTEAAEAEAARKECIEAVEKAKGSTREHEECERIAYYSGADFPASSPDVVAVGGTKLKLIGGLRSSETVWNEDPNPEGGNEGAGGGGCSAIFEAQPWQQEVPDWSEVGCGQRRAVADVAADADPYTGAAVYDSVPDPHYEVVFEEGKEVLVPVNTPLRWWPIGGTSEASPIVAAMFALAGGSDGVEYPAETLYAHLGSSALYDVSAGGNGECDDDYSGGCKGSLSSPLDCGAGELICNAGSGYDGPTGVGTPNAIAAFEPVGDNGGKSGKEGAERNEEPKSGGAPSGSQPPAVPAGSSLQPGISKPAAQVAKPEIVALTLSRSAKAALVHAEPKAKQVVFGFKLSAAAKVEVELQRRVDRKGRQFWQKLSHDSLAFAAAAGEGQRQLTASGKLVAGRYRLTLSIRGGGSRSIVFTVG